MQICTSYHASTPQLFLTGQMPPNQQCRSTETSALMHSFKNKTKTMITLLPENSPKLTNIESSGTAMTSVNSVLPKHYTLTLMM